MNNENPSGSGRHSKSVHKRLEAQVGQKLFTQTELDAAVAQAVAAKDAEITGLRDSLAWALDRMGQLEIKWTLPDVGHYNLAQKCLGGS